MIKNNWKISVFYDDEKTKLLFTKEYKNVKEITKDFNLTRNFLYDFSRWQKNGVCLSTSRKQKCIQKYKRIIIEKSRKLKDGTIKKDVFKL